LHIYLHVKKDENEKEIKQAAVAVSE